MFTLELLVLFFVSLFVYGLNLLAAQTSDPPCSSTDSATNKSTFESSSHTEKGIDQHSLLLDTLRRSWARKTFDRLARLLFPHSWLRYLGIGQITHDLLLSPARIAAAAPEKEPVIDQTHVALESPTAYCEEPLHLVEADYDLIASNALAVSA